MSIAERPQHADDCDRMFHNRMATHMLAFEGDSHVEWFEGNFEDRRGTPALAGDHDVS